MRDPFPFLRVLEKPFLSLRSKFHQFYPIKSQYPVTKFMIYTTLGVYIAWETLPYQYMFRHFQISEYTVSRGYLHSIITGSLSHKDQMHMIPNLFSYFVFGRLIELTAGSRRLFYLFLTSSLLGIATVVVTEKLLPSEDQVRLIVPKCNGSVVGSALAAAVLVRYPFKLFNPLGLSHRSFNEMLMIPAFIGSLLYGMTDYFTWQQGYVEYISREAHIVGALSGALYALRYLK